MITYQRLSATAKLIILNAAIFLILALCLMIGGATAHIGDIVALPSDIALAVRRPWSLVTYMFVHFNLWHLLVNMLWLLMCGRILALTVRDHILWAVYITGGLVGGLLYLCGSQLTGGISSLCGASASVIALMVVAGLRSPNMEVSLFLLGNIRLKWVVGVAILILFIGGGSFFAHLGGVIAGGGCYAYFFIRTPRRKNGKLQKQKKREVKKVKQAMLRHRADNQRLDELIDKIRISGYQSLNVKEQRELSELTKRLKKDE